MATPQSLVAVCMALVLAVDGYGDRLENVLGNYMQQLESSENNDNLYTNRYSGFTAEKRGAGSKVGPGGEKLNPVPFYCNKHTAVCRHGGIGPRVTFPKNDRRPVCVCLCPKGYTTPQCREPTKRQ